MKNVIIVHRWEGNSNSDWYPWLKENLEKKGFNVKSFDMPNTENPKIEEWVNYLRENLSDEDIDEETWFVGHSVGCQTILRYLEKLHKHKKIKGCIFVAPWLDLINLSEEEMEIAHPWINETIDFERILDHCNEFTCVFSNNDPYVNLDEANKFEEKLGAKIIIKENKGHFTEEDSVKKLPEVLDFIK